MKIYNTFIKDLLIIQPTKFNDERGWFSVVFNNEFNSENKINYIYIQENKSFSRFKGTLRGIHLQSKQFGQTKLVSCIQGKIFDVAVDLRPESETYLKWFGIELSSENNTQLLIPSGFGHGFITLVDDTTVSYKVDNYYNKDAEISIIYNDSRIGIEWPILPTVLSDKDLKGIEIAVYEELVK